MKWRYTSRGHAFPQGKPRIYFTAHLADYALYFQSICDDIFAVQNGVIYYDEEPQAPYDREELFLNLSQMQLVVIPITRRFLTEDNRARLVEFQYAMAHHIPILPLIQEDGLRQLFNDTCGRLQTLYKNNPRDDQTGGADSTAIPYERKLADFLSALFISDELAQKVRAAFDAYIFLSYRKKDRQYAQQLMRLIHQNPDCWSIAIWYDEFLTPGENFNEAIKAALEKSEVFAMVITPRMVEAPNYVIRTEYPNATRLNKTILPVQLELTDTQAIQQSFADIPPCIDAKDEAALSDALIAALRNVAIGKQDNSPEHTFFMGLAYLNGIDVEVDTERAVALMTEAAEANLPEAIEMLVTMYRTGAGVMVSYQAAIAWQKRLVALRQKEFNAQPTEKNGVALTLALRHLGDYQWEIGAWPEAEATYQAMQDVCRSRLQQEDTLQAKRDFSASCDLLGIICLKTNRLAQAKDYFRQGLALDERLLAEDDSSLEAWRNVAISCNHLGELCLGLQEWEEAEDYFRKGQQISAKMLLQSNNAAEAKADYSVTIEGVARAIFQEGAGDAVRAAELFRQALELRKEVWQEERTDTRLIELAVVYYNVSLAEDGENALEAISNAYKIWYGLRQKSPEVPLYNERYAIAQKALEEQINQALQPIHQNYENALELMDNGSWETAKMLLLAEEEHCRKIWQLLDGLPDKHAWQVISWDICLILSNIDILASQAERMLEEIEAAFAHCKQAIAIQTWLQDKSGQDRRLDLARAYLELGRVYTWWAKLDEATLAFRRSGTYSTTVYKETLSAIAYDLFAEALLHMGTISNYRQGSSILYDIKLILAAEDIWSELAQLYPEERRYTEERDQIWQQLLSGQWGKLSLGEQLVIETLKKASVICQQAADDEAKERLQDAFQGYQQAIALFKKIAEGQPLADLEPVWQASKRQIAYSGICACYESLGDIYQKSHQLKAADDCYNQSLYMRKILMQKGPGRQEQFAYACYRISHKAQGSWQKQCLADALAAYEALSKQYPQALHFAQIKTAIAEEQTLSEKLAQEIVALHQAAQEAAQESTNWWHDAYNAAEAFYKQAEDKLYQLQKISHQLIWRKKLAQIYTEHAALLLKFDLSKRQSASQMYLNALFARYDIWQDEPTAENMDKLAQSYLELGKLTLDKAKLETALKFYQDLCRTYPHDEFYQAKRQQVQEALTEPDELIETQADEMLGESINYLQDVSLIYDMLQQGKALAINDDITYWQERFADTLAIAGDLLLTALELLAHLPAEDGRQRKIDFCHQSLDVVLKAYTIGKITTEDCAGEISQGETICQQYAASESYTILPGSAKYALADCLEQLANRRYDEFLPDDDGRIEQMVADMEQAVRLYQDAAEDSQTNWAECLRCYEKLINLSEMKQRQNIYRIHQQQFMQHPSSDKQQAVAESCYQLGRIDKSPYGVELLQQTKKIGPYVAERTPLFSPKPQTVSGMDGYGQVDETLAKLEQELAKKQASCQIQQNARLKLWQDAYNVWNGEDDSAYAADILDEQIDDIFDFTIDDWPFA